MMTLRSLEKDVEINDKSIGIFLHFRITTTEKSSSFWVAPCDMILVIKFLNGLIKRL